MADLCFSRLPVDVPPCWISGGFGEWYGSGGSAYQHRGTDIAGAYGTPVYAPAEGRRVDLYNPDGSFGNAIVLDHEGTPWYSILAHLAYPPLPAMGERVLAGALIGYMDSTGMSTGNHVHWQVSTSLYFPPDISTCADPLSMLCAEEDDMTPAEVQAMIDASIAPVVASLNNLNSSVLKMQSELGTLNDALVKRFDVIEAASGPMDNVREAWERLRAGGNLEPGDTGGPSAEMVGAPSGMAVTRGATQAGDEAGPIEPFRRRGPGVTRWPDEDER